MIYYDITYIAPSSMMCHTSTAKKHGKNQVEVAEPRRNELQTTQLQFVALPVENHVGVSKNRDTPKSSILIGFSIINHPFWGTPIFGNIHVVFL